jgi:hypothetical protein
MNKPTFVFDGRNLLDREMFRRIGSVRTASESCQTHSIDKSWGGWNYESSLFLAHIRGHFFALTSTDSYSPRNGPQSTQRTANSLSDDWNLFGVLFVTLFWAFESLAAICFENVEVGRTLRIIGITDGNAPRQRHQVAIQKAR